MEETTSPQGTPQDNAQGTTEERVVDKQTQQFGMTDEQHATLKKALSQKEKLRDEVEKLRVQNESYKQTQLEAEGKKDEVISYWKTKAIDTEKTLKEKTSAYGWNVVSAQIKSELVREGCVNPEKALKLIDKKELSSVEIDDSYQVSQADLRRVVELLKVENQDIGLFHTNKAVKDMSPNAHVEMGTNDTEKSVEKMSASEAWEWAEKNNISLM